MERNIPIRFIAERVIAGEAQEGDALALAEYVKLIEAYSKRLFELRVARADELLRLRGTDNPIRRG